MAALIFSCACWDGRKGRRGNNKEKYFFIPSQLLSLNILSHNLHPFFPSNYSYCARWHTLHLPNVNFLATKNKAVVFGLSAVFNNLSLKFFTFLRASFGSHSENTVLLQTRKSYKLDARGFL